jgi:hypothetical protein
LPDIFEVEKEEREDLSKRWMREQLQMEEEEEE